MEYNAKLYGIRFPYGENSLDGVLGYGVRKLKVNINYVATLSST